MTDNPFFLTGHTVALRVPEPADVLEGNWHVWYNDYDKTRFNTHGVFPIGREQEWEIVKRTMADRSGLLLAIVEKETGKLLGNVALQRIDFVNRHASIAMTIGEAAPFTAGIEAFGLLVEHAVLRLNLNRLHAATHEGVLAFVRMLGAIGFEYEGRGRQHFIKDGRTSDIIYYAALAETVLALRDERGGHLLFATQAELMDAVKAAMSREFPPA